MSRLAILQDKVRKAKNNVDKQYAHLINVGDHPVTKEEQAGRTAILLKFSETLHEAMLELYEQELLELTTDMRDEYYEERTNKKYFENMESGTDYEATQARTNSQRDGGFDTSEMRV